MGTHIVARNRALPRWTAVAATTVLCLTACNRMKDTDANYTRAINKYYESHPSCLFDQPVRFPAQADGSNAREAARYEALADQNLLTRSSGEKKVMVIAEKQVTSYDLSSTGHKEWVGDPSEPGYGNLCYGHRKVAKIDSSSPTTSTAGATTNVFYRYTVTGVPDWAKTQEIGAAFPGLQADLTGRQVGRATLEDTRKGWQVTSAPWAHIEDSDIYK